MVLVSLWKFFHNTGTHASPIWLAHVIGWTHGRAYVEKLYHDDANMN